MRSRLLLLLLLLLLAITACGDAFSADEQRGTDASSDVASSSDAPGDAVDGPADADMEAHRALDASDARADVVEHDAQVDAGHDAPAEAAPPACTCPNDAGPPTSCYYALSEPAPGYGSPEPVASIVLTRSNRAATWSQPAITTPYPHQNMSWADLDVSAFTTGGTLTISGLVGATGCTLSTILVDQCVVYPKDPPLPVIEDAPSIAPGTPWSFPPYAFAAGTTVLHVGAQCAFASGPTSNADQITASVP